MTKIRFFRQHSLETCGISCILMVLDAFHKVQYPTEKQEHILYGVYHCRSFKGTLSSAIAECLCKNGLKVELFHSSPGYLDNQNGYYSETIYQAMKEEYAKTINAIQDRVRVETNCSIIVDDYRRQLDEGKLLIVQCFIPGNADGIHDKTLHWILLYGYEGDCFYACDPLSGKIQLATDELEGYSRTPVGHIYIAASKDRI